MNNLCLPMKVINITQHSGGSYSHPNGALDLAGSDTGIDFAFAMGNFWRCISGPWGSHTYFFTACDEAGNAVPVHCADGKDRIVTVAMTHAAFQYVKAPVIGKIYKNGEPIYEEGTYSADPNIRITGNHIHYEVAEGLQYSKYYDRNMGVYRMYGELKPEDICFICDSFSTVASMGGVVMAHCEGVAYTTPQTSFADGLSHQTYSGQDIHIYKMSGREKIAIVACPYGQVKDITEFSIPNKRIKAVMNASYFMMNGDNGYLGRVQGFLNGTDEHVDARPASPAEMGQKGDKPFMDLVLLKNGNISFGDFNSWDYPIEEVVFGVSPAGIEISNFIAVNKYSPAVGYEKISYPNTQSVLMRCSDGTFVLAAVSGKLAPVPTLRTWGLVNGVAHMSIYDSGGSTQLIVNGEKIVYTGRKIPVCFVIYEDYEADDDEQKIPTDTIGKVHCEKSGMHIRSRVGGEIMHTVKRGDVCDLLGFIDGIQKDGYQWAYVKSSNVSGYAQIDSAVLWIELFI